MFDMFCGSPERLSCRPSKVRREGELSDMIATKNCNVLCGENCPVDLIATATVGCEASLKETSLMTMAECY